MLVGEFVSQRVEFAPCSADAVVDFYRVVVVKGKLAAQVLGAVVVVEHLDNSASDCDMFWLLGGRDVDSSCRGWLFCRGVVLVHSVLRLRVHR